MAAENDMRFRMRIDGEWAVIFEYGRLKDAVYLGPNPRVDIFMENGFIMGVYS